MTNFSPNTTGTLLFAAAMSQTPPHVLHCCAPPLGLAKQSFLAVRWCRVYDSDVPIGHSGFFATLSRVI
jgi:hypothetical protein